MNGRGKNVKDRGFSWGGTLRRVPGPLKKDGKRRNVRPVFLVR